jgi:hypothetical protein
MAPAVLNRKQSKQQKTTSTSGQETLPERLQRLVSLAMVLQSAIEGLMAQLRPNTPGKAAELKANAQQWRTREEDEAAKVNHTRRLANREIGTPGQIAESQKARKALPKMEADLAETRNQRIKAHEAYEHQLAREAATPEVSAEAQALIDNDTSVIEEQRAKRKALKDKQQQLATINEALSATRAELKRQKAAMNRQQCRERLDEHKAIYRKLRGQLLDLQKTLQQEHQFRLDLAAAGVDFGAPLQPCYFPNLDANGKPGGLVDLYLQRMQAFSEYQD